MLFSTVQMHVPDGFLSIPVSFVLWVITIITIGYSLRCVSRELDERKVPLIGVLAAAIFAGQMLNFAVAGGTSGHLMGAALATILVGPWAAVLVMTTVVGVQALIFQDGGLVALGANLINMAVIGVAVAYAAYRPILKLAGGRKGGIFLAGFIAAWLSIEIAALAVAFELALSGASPANLAIPAMAGIHALIGIGEGLITVGCLAFIYAIRPSLLTGEAERPTGNALIWVTGLLISLALVVASPLASARPDGLEWVAQQQGFLNRIQSPLYEILPDYIVPGISTRGLTTILAGLVGVLLVFLVALAVALTRRGRNSSP